MASNICSHSCFYILLRLRPPISTRTDTLFSFATLCRSTRQVREREYIVAAHSLGCSPLHILVHEVFPNVVNPLIVVATLEVANAILLEARSEEHTSELQSLMRISYAVFCLKNKKYITLTKIISIGNITHQNYNNTY